MTHRRMDAIVSCALEGFNVTEKNGHPRREPTIRIRIDAAGNPATGQPAVTGNRDA